MKKTKYRIVEVVRQEYNDFIIQEKKPISWSYILLWIIVPLCPIYWVYAREILSRWQNTGHYYKGLDTAKIKMNELREKEDARIVNLKLEKESKTITDRVLKRYYHYE